MSYYSNSKSFNYYMKLSFAFITMLYFQRMNKKPAAVCASINNNEWAVSLPKSTFRNPKNKMNTNDYVTENNNLPKLWCGIHTHTSSTIVMLNLNLLHIEIVGGFTPKFWSWMPNFEKTTFGLPHIWNSEMVLRRRFGQYTIFSR